MAYSTSPFIISMEDLEKKGEKERSLGLLERWTKTGQKKNETHTVAEVDDRKESRGQKKNETHTVAEVDDLAEFTELVHDYYSAAPQHDRSEWIHRISARFGVFEKRQKVYVHRFIDKKTLSKNEFSQLTARFLTAKGIRMNCTAPKNEGLEPSLKYGGYQHLKGVLDLKFVSEHLLPEIMELVTGKESEYKKLHNTIHQVESLELPAGCLDPDPDQETEVSFLQGIIGEWLRLQWPEQKMRTTLLMRNSTNVSVLQWKPCLPHWDHSTAQCTRFGTTRTEIQPVFVIIPLSDPSSLNLHCPYVRPGRQVTKPNVVVAHPGDVLIVLWDCCHSTGKPVVKSDDGEALPTYRLHIAIASDNKDLSVDQVTHRTDMADISSLHIAAQHWIKEYKNIAGPRSSTRLAKKTKPRPMLRTARQNEIVDGIKFIKDMCSDAKTALTHSKDSQVLFEAIGSIVDPFLKGVEVDT
jgi:hypothetical protein